MKKLILSVLAAFGFIAGAHAAGGEGIHWDKAPDRTNDLPALQNGAKLFVNYCLNCHSAAFMRFNRLQDIGLGEQQIKDNLLFVSDKVGDTMKSPIDPKEAKEWFGAVPPDLTLIARSRAGNVLIACHARSASWRSDIVDSGSAASVGRAVRNANVRRRHRDSDFMCESAAFFVTR